MEDGDRFEELLAEAEARPLRGWDFSWLGERMRTAALTWDYDGIVLRLAQASPDLLDLGTGGGEWLASLPHRPVRTVATEPWEPNVEVARSLLHQLGVTVVAVEAAPDNVDQEPAEERGHLPFPAESFELVVSRHESFVAAEVARVLVPGGRFVTQQVGGGPHDELRAILGIPPRPPQQRAWTLALAVSQLEGAGLRITDSAEGELVAWFTDVGALAWFLKAAPWVVPGFSLRAHRAGLAQLHRRITAEGPYALREPAFCVEALKPRAR
jgi:SAM-dependent methyltransferase